MSEWLPSYQLPKNSIEFEALKQMIFTLDIQKERNRVGNNMYSSALNHYGNYLKELNIQDQTIFTSAYFEFNLKHQHYLEFHRDTIFEK